MHRQHSLLPFSRHYSHSTHPFLDLLQISADDSTISVNSSETPTLLPILKRHLDVKRRGLMLSIPFVTVNEYLWMLRAVSEQMASAGRQGMFYLAAAVSDFFLPPERMVREHARTPRSSRCHCTNIRARPFSQSEHKIQSSTAFSSAETDDGRLTLTMDQVPKILRPLVQEWAHEGYIVSFKVRSVVLLFAPIYLLAHSPPGSNSSKRTRSSFFLKLEVRSSTTATSWSSATTSTAASSKSSLSSPRAKSNGFD